MRKNYRLSLTLKIQDSMKEACIKNVTLIKNLQGKVNLNPLNFTTLTFFTWNML